MNDKYLDMIKELIEYAERNNTFNLTTREFREFECTVEEALEKQTPKIIKVENWMYTKCECGKDFSVGGYDGYYSVPYEDRINYCPDCGQRLDWK